LYFSLEVKKRREDFYNMEEELETLKREILDPKTRMIVIKGVRRTGKSSLMRVALNELKTPHIFIDLRLSGPLTPEAIYEYFSMELSKFLEDGLLRRMLSRVRGVEISGLKLEFAEKRMDVLGRILDELGRWAEGRQVVMALDEAQELRILRGFDKILAHIYDYVGGIKIMLAGSEIGLLDKLLGISNPKAPLFGRPFSEINLKKLNWEKAVEFLKMGFEQVNIKVSEDEIQEAVSKLDGIIGWLTFYGHLRTKGDPYALEKAVENGSKMVAEEFNQFLSGRQIARKRYIEVVKTLIKPSTWSEVKRSLRGFANVNDKQVSNYLKELTYYGFVEKKDDLYSISDPLLIEAIRRGYIR